MLYTYVKSNVFFYNSSFCSIQWNGTIKSHTILKVINVTSVKVSDISGNWVKREFSTLLSPFWICTTLWAAEAFDSIFHYSKPTKTPIKPYLNTEKGVLKRTYRTPRQHFSCTPYGEKLTFKIITVRFKNVYSVSLFSYQINV